MVGKKAVNAACTLVINKGHKLSHAFITAVLLCLVFGIYGFAQDEHALHEVYQAQAIGQDTQAGQTFSVTVHIDEYSTPEELQILAEAFNKGGSKGLYNALDKMSSRGHIAIIGTLGYDIKFAQKLPAEEGFKLVVVTNRPVYFRESWYDGHSLDYNLSYLEMIVDKETGKGMGTLIPAALFKMDKKSGGVQVEAYKSPWKLTNIQDRTKK